MEIEKDQKGKSQKSHANKRRRNQDYFASVFAKVGTLGTVVPFSSSLDSSLIVSASFAFKLLYIISMDASYSTCKGEFGIE